ncbi:hypothetical protein ACP3JE_005126, partial [Escherichia coli]
HNSQYCMVTLHDNAFVSKYLFDELQVVLVRVKDSDSTAFKLPHEAGGRGGESTARWRWC